MATAVSAPGKVFLAGGYLVLDRAYTALVFGLSARIHVLVSDIDTSSGVELSQIVVQSPQFREAAWIYGYHLTSAQGGVDVTQLHGYEHFSFCPRLFSLIQVPLLPIGTSPLFLLFVTCSYTRTMSSDSSQVSGIVFVEVNDVVVSCARVSVLLFRLSVFSILSSSH